jgi:cytoskeletal protein CcmA (bactofilin family)
MAMFRKRPGEDGEDAAAAPDAPAPVKPLAEKPGRRAGHPSGYNPEIRRPPVDIPGPKRPAAATKPARQLDSRTLIVGRDISLKGEIAACQRLIVEGAVWASLTDARLIEVAEGGYFKGDAHVEEAVISGRFDGELVAHGKLTVRAGGRVTGTIRYADVVIESGGEIAGEMNTLEPDEADRLAEAAAAGDSDDLP